MVNNVKFIYLRFLNSSINPHSMLGIVATVNILVDSYTCYRLIPCSISMHIKCDTKGITFITIDHAGVSQDI